MNETFKIPNSEHALKLLNVLQDTPQVSQRHLAKKLEISLGKINFLINALLKKGFIEAKNFKNSKNKAAYRYLLTAEGLKMKLDLTQKFLIWKLQEYEKLKKEIQILKKEMPNNITG